jgi:hypothetical protein
MKAGSSAALTGRIGYVVPMVAFVPDASRFGDWISTGPHAGFRNH